LARAIDRRDAYPGHEIDPVIAEELRRPQLDLVHPLLVENESLRQRRTLVGQMGLVADQGDWILIARRAQRGGGLEARLPGADDHAAVRVSHQRCDGGIVTVRPSSASV